MCSEGRGDDDGVRASAATAVSAARARHQWPTTKSLHPRTAAAMTAQAANAEAAVTTLVPALLLSLLL